MAHVVGVPRRDPCQKCQLPVFLAERLTVGKKVFHRTCLKCARCGSQLTIGSFYETEVDDVFCCETCPDEEELEDGVNNAAASSCSSGSSNAILQQKETKIETTPTTSTRSSIADRLAFFEQNKSNSKANPSSSKLIERSLSDEEKRKGLQATSPTLTPTYQGNAALSNFLNDTIDGGDHEVDDCSDQSSSSGVNRYKKDETPMETTDSEESLEDESIEHITDLTNKGNLPELPKTAPPTIEVKDNVEPIEKLEKRFTATAELQLSTISVGETEIGIDQTDRASPDNVKLNNDFSGIDEKPNNNQHESPPSTDSQQVTDAHKSQTHKSDNYLDISATNINESVTKDSSTDATQMLGKNVDDEIVELRRKSPEKERERERGKGEATHIEDKATTERLSVVRARLQHFEEITNNNNINYNNDSKISYVKSQSPEENNLVQANTFKVKNLDLDNDNDNKHDNDDNVNVKTETSNTLEDIKLTDDGNAKNEVPKSIQHENQKKNEIFIAASLAEETKETIVTPQPRNVPSPLERKDKLRASNEQSIELRKSAKPKVVVSPIKTPLKAQTRRKIEDYPEDLNPFNSIDEDDDDDEDAANKENSVSSSRYSVSRKSEKSENSNPFDSSDDEIELEKSHRSLSASMVLMNSVGKIRPPRPPPPRISRNPFDDDDDNEEESLSRHSSLNSSAKKRTPVPTPRTYLSQSQNPTPEATPRLSNKASPQSLGLNNSNDYYGSINSLPTAMPLHRNSDIRGSNNSLTSSGGTVRSRKSRKAPAPPQQPPTVKELFPSTDTLGSSKTSTPSSSNVGSPKTSRKKRPAPAPPKPSRLEANILPQITHVLELNGSGSKNLHSYPLQSTSESKLSDEEKALLEGKTDTSSVVLRSKEHDYTQDPKLVAVCRRNSRRLIPLDATLIRDAAENAHEAQCDDQKQQQIDQDEHNVVYRRTIMPPSFNTPIRERNPLMDNLSSQDRQSEKLKDNKEAQNRNRQSQQSASSGAEDADSAIYNKSAHGKWKRRKGPAPALPIPPRRVLQMLPLQEIRHELEIIEVQQQGLEKQGVVLEKMIRDRCEGQCGELLTSQPAPTNPLAGAGDSVLDGSTGVQNTKEVEDLILQLFELVNEKNELFRRQAELMYLRRQHRLEQEQADLEYEIRVLMAQPERNKTDSDKSREEALIARLVKVVQLRNEVVECLEMDRLREAEEDLSIKQRLEQHTARRNSFQTDETGRKSSSKLSKKEKKKQKEAKKLSKNKKIDADKDADESELTMDKQKLKKKKRKFLF